MIGNSGQFNPTGSLEIWKHYPDGEKELVFEDNNVITSGMGSGLAYLHSGLGSSSILDYQITYFQVGTGGTYTGLSETIEYDETQEKLITHLPKDSDYGAYDSSVNRNVVFMEVENLQVSLKDNFTAPQPLARIRHSNIHRVNKSAVRYTLPLLERNCNNFSLNEIGLFMKNPRGPALSADRPKLVAYRQFPEIKKTRSFTLVFLWTLQF